MPGLVALAARSSSAQMQNERLSSVSYRSAGQFFLNFYSDNFGNWRQTCRSLLQILQCLRKTRTPPFSLYLTAIATPQNLTKVDNRFNLKLYAQGGPKMAPFV